MNVHYDRSSDAAYISLGSEGDAVGLTVSLAELVDEDFSDVEALGQINLDFSASGRLTGIEVLSASRVLPASALPDSRPAPSP